MGKHSAVGDYSKSTQEKDSADKRPVIECSKCIFYKKLISACNACVHQKMLIINWEELKSQLFIAGSAGHFTTIEVGDVLSMMERIEKGVVMYAKE